MKRITQHGRTTEKHADIRLFMFLRQTSKHPIPIRPSKMCRRTQARNRIPFGTDIRNVNVRHVVVFDFGGQVDANLDSVLRVLFFDGVQERMEPFGRTEIADHPDEVDFGEAGGRRVVKVVHAVPNVLEDGGKGRYTDTSPDQQNCLVVEEILAGGTKRTIDHDAREHTVKRWRYDFSSLFASTLFGLAVKVASESLGQ